MGRQRGQDEKLEIGSVEHAILHESAYNIFNQRSSAQDLEAIVNRVTARASIGTSASFRRFGSDQAHHAAVARGGFYPGAVDAYAGLDCDRKQLNAACHLLWEKLIPLVGTRDMDQINSSATSVKKTHTESSHYS